MRKIRAAGGSASMLVVTRDKFGAKRVVEARVK